MNPSKVYLYSGINTDSKSKGVPASFPDGTGVSTEHSVDEAILHPSLYEARVTKTQWEKAALQFSNKMSSGAHIHVMRKVRPGMMEYQMEADFMHYCYYNGGMRHQSYTSICGCGPNAAVLHYGHAGAPNNRKIKKGDMILTDQGLEYYCYASDITCSYPVDGQFTPEQRGIYEAVLDATVRVIKSLKPGVSWVAMHDLAHRTVAEHLLKLGYLCGDLDDICKAQVPDLFMPHGLGHLMGVDTHDVGGIPVGVQKYKTLRMNRDLVKDMCLTVEPGCYFIPALLDKAFEDEAKAKHLNQDKLRAMYNFGGVRIEDDLFITEHGCRLITNVPRTVKEIEAVMSGMDFPIPDSDYPIPREP
jgi:Xaa-Pro dipeptidase